MTIRELCEKEVVQLEQGMCLGRADDLELDPATAQLHGIEVYCAGRTAQNGHAQRSKRRDAQHPVQQLPHQKQQQPCQQIRPEMGENKADKGISGQ